MARNCGCHKRPSTTTLFGACTVRSSRQANFTTPLTPDLQHFTQVSASTSSVDEAVDAVAKLGLAVGKVHTKLPDNDNTIMAGLWLAQAFIVVCAHLVTSFRPEDGQSECLGVELGEVGPAVGQECY